MSFIALKRMKVGDGYREYGEPIPEAADWRPAVLAAYQSSNYVRPALLQEYEAAEKKLADRQALEAKREKEAEKEARRTAKAAQKAAEQQESETGDDSETDGDAGETPDTNETGE